MRIHISLILGLYLGCAWGAPVTLHWVLQCPWGEVFLWAGMPLLALTSLWLSCLPRLSELCKGLALGCLLAPLILAAFCIWQGGLAYLVAAQGLSGLILWALPWKLPEPLFAAKFSHSGPVALR